VVSSLFESSGCEWKCLYKSSYGVRSTSAEERSCEICGAVIVFAGISYEGQGSRCLHQVTNE